MDMICAVKLVRESDRFGGYAKVKFTLSWSNWNVTGCGMPSPAFVGHFI